MPQDFARIIRNLRHCSVDFVVIGANAAIAQGAPIGTIDLASDKAVLPVLEETLRLRNKGIQD